MPYKKIQEIIQNRKSLTNKEKIILDYIIENINEVTLLSATQLANKAGAGKATFFRFLKNIGYESFNDFRQDIHEFAANNVNSNFWQTHALINKENQNNNFLYNSVEESTELLTKMITVGLNESFNEASKLLDSTDEIIILGCRTSKQLAIYFENLLTPLGKKITQLSSDENLAFDKVSTLNSNCTLFLISGWPYSTTIVQVGEFANKLGIPIIFLTNNISCSISSFADIILLIPSSDKRYSIIPFVSVIEALTNDLFSKSSEKVSTNLKKIDRALEKYKQFSW